MKPHRKIMVCQICGKSTQIGNNRPKSLHKTSRTIHPNIQKWHGLLLCTRCKRVLKERLVNVAQEKTAA